MHFQIPKKGAQDAAKRPFFAVIFLKNKFVALCAEAKCGP